MINTREAGDANLRSVTLHQIVAEYAHSIFWWMLHIISNLNTLFFAGSIFDITFAASWYSTWNLLQVEIADRSCSSDTVAELGQYSHPCRYQRMQYPNSTSLTIPTVFTQYHLPASTCQLPYYWTPCLWSSYGSPLRFLHNTQSHSQPTLHIIQLWLGLSISREAQNQVQSEYDTSRSIWFSTRYINLRLVRLFIEHPNCFQWLGIPTVFAKPIAFVPVSHVCAHGLASVNI